MELVDSGFEYFAGGGLKKVTGADKDKTSLYDLAEAAAYKVTYTQAVTADDSKVILIDEHLADSDAMDYEMDRVDGEWALADYAAKEHPEETLILVTGDHEPGGLTIGFAGTDYDTYLDTLTNQKISYAQFDEQYMASYKENLTSFEDAMKDVEALFGLKMVGEENDRLVLTEYEIQRLRTAYDLSMTDYNVDEFTQEQYVLYGEYNPFSVTVTHILNNKSGVDFTSYSHTGLPVAVFADGIGAEAFSGYYDNTEIYNRLAAMLGIN
ncbi:alkaline phosphatase [Fusibacillus kribbianus]|uniref:Alkaline phosphatase n=1 Tax=Fusibacillus kribbianus TaxID=3044208 RepID=A0AAP4BA02_9FIRM|nr:alkaline phosphatase [Ruminococcus sp. YH-rum2234]MDI9241418.1 alkaline phosphatase [Ruminococcus sp. YH-rum2234]